MNTRWLVERKRDDFESVGADWFRVQSGALVFYGEDDKKVYVLAPGEWVSVVPDEAT